MMTDTNNAARTNEVAEAFHARLAEISLADVPVSTLPREATLKDQAAEARKVFKSLGLKGVSCTAPRYSMASSVEVSIPKRDDYTFDKFGMVVDGDAARAANNEAAKKVDAILFAAFPNHRDRSEYVSDYFDFCWSVG